jgi:SAM-dependent methyltransferase
VADAIFEERRLAEIYDPMDPDRSDLDAYVALAESLGARQVLDIGCGTGTFACLLAGRGIEVTAVDPAGASLDVARAKPGADQVRWIHGDATMLPPLRVDLATMTANVAQVFLTDEEWEATLRCARAALRPGGHLVFETRDPQHEAWRAWNREDSCTRADIPGAGSVESWVEVTNVSGQLVSFRGTYVFEEDGAVLISDSTLRFRGRDEVADSLLAAGFAVAEVRDAPERPGREYVFVAVRALRKVGDARSVANVGAGAGTIQLARSPADMRIGDRGELADQRRGEKNEPERNLIEAAQLPAAGGEQERDHGRNGQDEGEGVHAGSKEGSAPEIWAVASGRLQFVDIDLRVLARQRPMFSRDIDEDAANGVAHRLRPADVDVAVSGKHAPDERALLPDPVLDMIAAARPLA